MPSVLLPHPSIWTRNSVLMRRDDSFSPSVLLPHSESTSSMKMRDGFFSRAISKRFLTRRSDSPCHLLTRSEEDTEKNVLSHSVAQAFARKDLPVPGGPYKRMPFHGLRAPVNNCGNLIGKMMASLSASLALSRPATSSHLTLGFSVTMEPASAFYIFLFSSSSPSFFSFFFAGAVPAPPSPPPCGSSGAI